jgi:hypothetical protein
MHHRPKVPAEAVAWLFALPFCWGAAQGGEVDVAEAAQFTKSPDRELATVMPGWLAGMEGTIGVNGIEAGVDVGFDDIVKNLDMIAAGGLEGRYGKFGFILEGIYVKASFGGDTPGPLLSGVSVGVEQVLAEGTLTYRFFENDRAWIEFLAGARYVYMGNELSLSIDSAGVHSASAELSERIVDRATDAARQEVSRRLPGLLSQLENELAELKANAVSGIQDRVQEKVEVIKEAIRDRIDAGVGSPGPGFGAGIAQSGPIREAIRSYVDARVAAEIEAARAQVSAAVAEARARLRREVEKKLEAAEKKLAKAIEREITNRIPKSPVSASKAWVDPFVGFRGRCQLWENWYLTGRGDIGGFGVSSDLTWNAYGAVGLDLTKKTSLELGYRYLQLDYQSGAVSIETAMKGPYVGMRIEF